MFDRPRQELLQRDAVASNEQRAFWFEGLREGREAGERTGRAPLFTSMATIVRPARATKSTSRLPSRKSAGVHLRIVIRPVLACPRCDGRLRLIATVEDPRAIREVLDALALSTEPVDRAPPLSTSVDATPPANVYA